MSGLDKAAVAELYGELSRRLLVYFARRTCDGEVALDLTAETFARVLAGRRKFRGGSQGEAVAWVWGIARHVLGEYFERGRVERRALRRLGLRAPAVSDEFGRDLLAARPNRRRANAAVVALAALAVVVALSFTGAPPDLEVAVTPTPTPASAWPPPTPTPDPAAEAKVLRATPVDPEPLARRAWVRDVLGGSGREEIRTRLGLPPAPHAPELVGAWSVAELRGEVLLVDDGGIRCLSVPDPLSQYPQIERGSTCAPRNRWISLGMGDWWVGVVDPGTRPPVLRQPDGSREDLDGSSGLAVVEQAPGSRVTLFDARGKGRGDSARGVQIPWSCDDGRQFLLPAHRLPATDPCLEPPPPPRGRYPTRG